MKNTNNLKEIWQAFCTLSDIEEVLTWNCGTEKVSELVNHAKLHLKEALINVNPEELGTVVLDTLWCEIPDAEEQKVCEQHPCWSANHETGI